MSFKRLLVSLIAPIMIGCGASAQNSPAPVTTKTTGFSDLQLRLAPQSKYFTFGNYGEAEIDVTGAAPGTVSWSLGDGSVLPPDLTMTPTPTGDLLIQGEARFEGSWCFTAQATSVDGKTGSDEFCLIGQPNSAFPAPSFTTIRQLPDAIIGTQYAASILLDPRSIDASLDYDMNVDSTLPAGLMSSLNKPQERLLISGVPQNLGTFYFSVNVQQNGVYIDKQFALNILDQPATQPVCAPGYYYDTNLGYCVQLEGPTCSGATYYDPATNSCVPYTNGPIFCGPDEHYDYYLGECVLNSYPRCPAGTSWDPYDRRCESNRFSCPAGQHYSWEVHACVWNQQMCAPGQYWDPRLQSCVSRVPTCPFGSNWNPRTGRCEAQVRCGPGEIFRPDIGRCVPAVRCGPGEVYDPRLNRCVNTRPGGMCGPGERWDDRARRCVPVDHGPGPGPGGPGPGHGPGPGPGPGGPGPGAGGPGPGHGPGPGPGAGGPGPGHGPGPGPGAGGPGPGHGPGPGPGPGHGPGPGP
ncbi:MAG: hypothetical protein ACXVA9_05750, partial [Bdellovibrionales bacterium]